MLLRYITVYDKDQDLWYVYDTMDKVLVDYYRSSEYNSIIIMCENLNQGWEYIKENIEWME